MPWPFSSATGTQALRPEGAARTLLLLALLLAAGASGGGQQPTPELRERVRAALASADSFEDRFEADVWLMDMANRLGRQVPDPDLRIRILKTVHREARRADLPAEMVLAVIDIESAFDPYAVSSAGAQGLMQVMPFWREELGHRRLTDVEANILMGCTILRAYYEKSQGDWMEALARYNGSLGRRDYPQKVLDRLSRRWYRQ